MILEKLFKKNNQKYKLKILPNQIELDIDPKKTILQSILEAGIFYPHNCRVGSCTTCKSKLISGKVKELTDKAFVLDQKEIQENYILVCQSIPKSDIEIENLKLNPKNKIKAKFIKKINLTHDILEVEIQTEDRVFFKAGQYVHFYLDWLENSRIYSIANKPELKGNQNLKFFIRLVKGGKFTEWLFNSNIENIEFYISSPEGNFYLRNSNKPIMMIAGGSGLAPIFSILEDIIYNQEKEENQKNIKRKVNLLFGVRTEKDLYKQKELENIQKKWKNEFQIIPILSDISKDSSWQGEKGFIHHYLEKMPYLDEYQFYLCGPPIMIDKCLEVLSKTNVANNDIFYDKFIGQ